jgi:hypothetical protein
VLIQKLHSSGALVPPDRRFWCSFGPSITIWRRTYAITAVMALYFNVFVLVVQLFRRVPALSAMAPTQSEQPFQIAQLAVLLLFAAIGIRAATAKPQGGLVR